MARAFNIASKRISAGRVKKRLDNRFVASETEYTAAGFGSGAVYISGRIYQSNDVGIGTVKNIGRPAAAFYAAATGGGGSVVLAGGSGTVSSGGGTVSGDYLLRSGILPMTGNLDMGNFAISNVALVDGRDVSADGAALDGIRAASLLALATNDALAQERVLSLSTAFTVVDGGAGSTYSVSLATPGTLSATSSNNSVSNHTHAITASDNPGAAVSLLKTAADGNLTLTQLTTPLITTATNIDLVINPAGTGAVQFPNDQTLRTSSFDSSFPILGWQINEVTGITGYSALTIGKIQADELAVRVFVADEVRVDRGDEYWTKSYGIVAETFTSPASIGGTVSVMFEDSPALAGAIFTNDDWLLIRKLEIDTGITLFNLWGQVSGYVSNSDGTQNWTFTLRSGPTSEEITKGSLAIDFGASGAALIHLSVIDAAGAPYIKMRKWVTNPYTPANYTTYIQLGNLGSIGNSYYTPSGYGVYIRSTANEDQFMVADDNGFQIRGATFGLYNGANQTVLMDNASGINLDEDVYDSWDSRRALQWWPDVSSMSGDPSLSIYTGKHVGGSFADQNWSYIVASPSAGVLASLSAVATGQGTGSDAILYLEGGSQSLATGSSATVIADIIDLTGTTTFTGTGLARDFNPQVDLTYDLGTTLLRWNTLYVNQIVVSGSISGDILSGQEWEYPGSMIIDANSEANTTVTVTNQGTGTASLDVEGSITVAGTVDGVDISNFKSSYDFHLVSVNAHHSQEHVLATTSGLGDDHTVSGLSTGLVLRATGASTAAFTQLQHSELGDMTTGDPHTQYLLKAGGTISGNITVVHGITIDGIDISAHAANADAHHAKQHLITDSAVHTITSATLGIVGATATNTLGIITPSANPGTAGAILRSDNSGGLTLVQLTATTKVQTSLIDTGSGDLTIAPSGGTVNVTGIVNASTSVLTPTISTSSGNLSLNAVGGQVRVQSPVLLQSENYASQLTGWRVTYDGEADFRYLYTDQLYAKEFIADIEQALAGSQIITKSVTTLAQAFAVPYPGATLPICVDDLPSADDMAVFESGDFIRLRQSSRASGSLSVADCWGTVSSYTDQADKVQRWNFTRAGTATTATISQVGAVTTSSLSGSTSRTVNKVTGTASGHFMVAQVVINSTTVTITPPSGWTLYASGTVTGGKMEIYIKIAGGSEPSSYTWNFSSSVACAVGLQCLANVASYYSYQVNSNATPTNSMVGTAITALSNTDYLMFFGGIVGNVRATPPSGMSEIADFGSTGIGAYAAVQTVTAGDTGNKTATLASNAAYVCITLNLLPTYATGGLDSTSGAMGPGAVINPGSIVLDYGVSGNGYHEVTAVDGAYGANSPYSQVVTWTTHPATGQIVRTRMGNLYGITAVSGEYGLYAGDGGIAAGNQYLRVSTAGVRLNNVPIQLYNAGTQTVNLDSAGVDIWIGPSSGDKRLVWNGTTLSVIGVITVASGSSGIASFSDANLDNIADGTTYGRLDKTIIAGGLIQVGSGVKDSTLSGWHISGSEIVGQASGVDQVVMATTGKLTAGAGAVTLDVNGITLTAGTGEANKITWYNGATKYFEQYGYSTGATYRTVLNAASPSGATPSELYLYAQTSGASDNTHVIIKPGFVQIMEATLDISTSGKDLSLNGGDILLGGGGIDLQGGDIAGVLSITADVSTIAINGDLDMNGNDIFDVASLGIGTTVSGAWTSSSWTKSIVFASQGMTLLWNKGASGVARGIGVSSDGVLYITRSTANDNSAAPTYDMTVGITGGVTMNPAAGTGALTLTTPASQTAAMLTISSADNGSSYGPFIYIGRNTNGSTPATGFIQATNRAGTSYNLWPDASGNLRIGTTTPTNAQDSSGTVVGTQTSSLDSKIILGPSTTPDAAIEHVLQAARTALHQFRYKSGAFNDEIFQGIVTDYAPRYGMDRDATHPAGKSLNVIQLFNDLILSVEYLHNKLESFNGHC